MLTLPAARIALSKHVPIVLQTHGMIDRSTKLLAKPVDALLTRYVLRRAARVLYLTEQERTDVKRIGGECIHLTHLPNGVPSPPVENGGLPRQLEVLFLGRLHPIKRPRAFVAAARVLVERYPDVRFSLVGPDEGEGKAVDQDILESGSHQIVWEGSLSPEKTLERMRRASIFVLPSVTDVFPMSLLEAASCGLPSVVTVDCGLSQTVERWSAGVVVDDSIDSLVNAIDHLLDDAEFRREASENALDMVRSEFSMASVAGQLQEIYRNSVVNGC